MDKLISIVLPTYNGSKFIRTSIDSCLKQTYTHFELIIVNDCSTDDTEEIVKSYDDARIVYLKNEINQRLPKSLNIGFSRAKGEFFTWTSDDNYFADDALEKMLKEMEATSADLVCAPYHTIDEDNRITGSREVGPLENILLDNIVKACFLYKREVHETLGGYQPNLFLVEDYDFWIRTVFQGFRLSFLKEKLYYYRFHEASLTESRRKDIARALYHLLDSHIPNFINSTQERFVTAEVYLRMAKTATGIPGLNSKKYLKAAVKENFFIVYNNIFMKTAAKAIFKNI